MTRPQERRASRLRSTTRTPRPAAVGGTGSFWIFRRTHERCSRALRLPAAPLVESLTDFGQPGYGGPCPPEGAVAHRYEFTVYAIDVPSLGLDASAMPALAGYMIHAHSLGSVTLTARYGR